jgi:integrase
VAAVTREKKRRQYGTGGVHQRADGRWAGTIEAGYTATGARRRITVYGKTEAEAKTKLKERQRQIAAEGAPSTSVRTTVKAWSEEWLELTRVNLRPKPWATNRSAVRQWILPTIGHKRLEQLTPADVRAVADAQRAAGRSSSTAARTHTTLTSMLRAAILEGHQVPRRVLDVKAPELAPHDRTAMAVVEALAVLQVASFLPHGSRWAMAFLHGMRQGECLGLTWEQVDLDAGVVTVAWELQLVPPIDRKDRTLGYRLPEGLAHRHLVDGYHLLPPKTKAGFRVIPLVPAMREALADWKEIAPANPHDLVWPTVTGRPAN